MSKVMPVKGQSRLTDHFAVRKTSLRPQKNGKVNTAKKGLGKESTQPAEKIISSVNLHEGIKRKLESEVEIAQDVVKKVKLEKKASNREELKNEIKNKLLVSLPKENLTIDESDSTSTKPPAKARHSHLLDVKPSLSLPYNYSVLDNMFQSMDAAISFLFNRQELCLFLKIKRAVQEMTRRTFDMKHLKQIAKIFPEAYEFRYDECNPIDRDTYGNYHLVITPTFQASEVANKVFTKMIPSLMLERKKQFRSRITEIVKDHHEAFLQSLNPPVSVRREEITCWHRRFKLNEVPEVSLAELPQPPNVTTGASAKEVLDKHRGVLGKKIEAALEMVVKQQQQQQPIVPTSTSVKKTKDPLKGVPQFLRDKIRAKEMIRVQKELTRPPEVTKRMAMLAKLPEIARIIKSYFTTAKRASILLEIVLTNISDSLSTALSPMEIDRHFKLLAELVPEWVTLLTVRKTDYVKIDKAMDLNLVLAKFEEQT